MRNYRPDIHDFFPKTKRGHGSTHPLSKFRDGKLVRQACVCVNDACSLKRPVGKNGERRGEEHEDPAANVKEWRDERGYPKHASLEMCVFPRMIQVEFL